MIVVIAAGFAGHHYWPYWQAISAVKETLGDPDSAQFRALRFGTVASGTRVCGEFNARNRMGGYDGYQSFDVVMLPDGRKPDIRTGRVADFCS